MTDVPKDLKYTKGHTWVKVEDGTATVGISDFAQDRLGSILLFEVAEPGTQVTQGEPLGTVESDKATSDIMSPVSGEVVEVNQELIDAPETANDDPYEEGWVVKIRLSNPSDLNNLMDAAEFEKYVSE